MKTKIFLITFFILLCSHVYSQTTFKKIVGDANNDEIPIVSLELDNGNFLGIIYNIKTDPATGNTAISTIIEMNEIGETIRIVYFADCLIKNITQTGDNFFCYGYNYSDTEAKAFVMLLDVDYNIVNTNKYQIPHFDSAAGNDSQLSYDCMIGFEDNFYCIYTVTNYNPYETIANCFVFSNTADSINAYEFNAGIYDVCENPVEEGFIFAGIFFDYNCSMGGNLQLAYSDTELNITKVDCVDIPPSAFWKDCGIEPICNNIVISGIAINYYTGKLFGLGIFDTATTKLYYNTLGNNQEEMYHSYGIGMDVNTNKEIFGAAIYGYIGTEVYPSENNYIVIGKTDSLLNKKWEHFVGGDAYYLLLNVLACSDGGVLFSATRFDESINNQEFDACFIKLNADGCFTNIENKPQNLHNAILYPNPAKEMLNLRTAVQYVPATLEVYNISGIKVLTENITATEQTINIASLTTGNYIFRIIFQNETIETGKFIVE